MSISPTQEIIDELRAGRMVILVDDEDRENEGDLMIAAISSPRKPSISWPNMPVGSSV